MARSTTGPPPGAEPNEAELLAESNEAAVHPPAVHQPAPGSEQSSAASQNAPAVPPDDRSVVSQAEADAIRAELEHKVFVPSTNRLPNEVLPNPAFITILDQGQTAISVGAAVAAALNYLRAEQGETGLVSPHMLYQNARAHDEWPGEDYEGSSIGGALAGLSRRGVCLESEWPAGVMPRDVADRALERRPSSIRRIDKNLEHLRAAIFERHVIVVGAVTHSGWTDPKRGVIHYSARVGPGVMGGHAFAVVGYTPEGFLVQNSWSTAWAGVELHGQTYPGCAIWQYKDAEKNLTDAWVLQLSAKLFQPPLAGYDADNLDGEDLLEIRSEVNAFSYVLASRTIKPPLALGLFGDWGSGKSFFMQEMQKKIATLAEPREKPEADQAAEPMFCSPVVQIRFNAWHYLDSDLWASLVTEIFDKLFASIGGRTDRPEDKLPQLTKELESVNGVYQQAKQQLDDAVKARGAAEEHLRLAIEAREQREGELTTQLNDIVALVQGAPEVKKDLDRLAGDLGVPELRSSFEALDARATELTTLGRRFTALMQAMFTTPWGWARLLSLVGAILAPVLVVLAIEAGRRWLGVRIDDFHSFAVQLSTFFAAITAWLGVQAKRGARVLQTLEDTHRKLEVIRDQRRQAAVATEQATLLALKEKEDAARKSLQDAEQHVQTLKREIEDLQPGRLIMRFIEERTKSSDYRSRLGIVSLVRRDFERLSELADPASDKRNPDLMPVERIILYIDDLDRCKPERVIEVLEAVHLLLAFRLFMVVVAVDPRWLRRCLEKHYPDLLAVRTQEVATVAHVIPSRPATAQDYLEKIFQIPFLLQPLRDDGYRRMISGLTAGNVVVEPKAPVGGAAGAPLPKTSADGANVMVSGQAPARTSTPLSPDEDEEAADRDAAVSRLLIRDWELEDMRRLAPLFRTPRAVKRFVNTYRFLRAGIRPHELSMFEGIRDDPGTYRAALVLLAIVVCYSNVAPRFLHRLLDDSQNPTTSWEEFLRKARAETPRVVDHSDGDGLARLPARPAARKKAVKSAKPEPEPEPSNWEEVEWQQLCDALLGASKDGFPVGNIGELQPWVRSVARYSFSLAAVGTLES